MTTEDSNRDGSHRGDDAEGGGGPRQDRTGRDTRRIRRILAGVSAVALAGVLVAVVAGAGSNEPVATATVTVSTETVAISDLVDSERLDGSVESSDTLGVVHRIEGATPIDSNQSDGLAGGGGTALGSTEGLAETAATTGSPTGAAVLPLSLAGPADVELVAASVPDPCAPADPATTSTSDLVSGTSTTAPATTSTSDLASGTQTTAPTTTSTTDPCAPVDPPPSSTPSSTPSVTDPSETDPSAADPSVDPSTVDPLPPSTDGAGDGSPTGDGAPSGQPGSGGIGEQPGTGGTGAGTVTETDPVTEQVTSIVADGEQIDSGDVLYTADGSPVVALTGAVPAWRSLSDGVDDGADVEQLETALSVLGYDPGGILEIDQTFDPATTEVVEGWQEGLGVEVTGEVELGDVVFIPGPTTVVGVSAAVGDAVGEGSTVLDLVTDVQQVVAIVPTEYQAVVGPGLEVEVDGVTGRVVRLLSVSGGDEVQVRAVVALDEQLDLVSGSVVTVRLSITRATGVFVVPVEALASRLDGTYAVQVADGGAPGAWLTVIPGEVSGGDVEVAGDGLRGGLEVVVPG
jgi:peptidoglycan hydrolase-like protein with peptidoglycan-binding domain